MRGKEKARLPSMFAEISRRSTGFVREETRWGERGEGKRSVFVDEHIITKALPRQRQGHDAGNV